MAELLLYLDFGQRNELINKLYIYTVCPDIFYTLLKNNGK